MLRGTLVCIALGIAASGRAQPSLVEYPVEGGGFFFVPTAAGIASGPAGLVWYVNANATHSVGTVTLGGDTTGVAQPSGGEAATGAIAAAGDSYLWAGGGKNILKVMPGSGITFTAYPLPDQAQVHTIDSIAWDGATGVWFTDFTNSGRQIGRLDTTSGAVQEAPLPSDCQFPGGFGRDMVKGSDGNLWFTSASGACKIQADGSVVSQAVANPAGGITSGPDGRLWLGRYDGHAHLAAFDPHGCPGAACQVATYDLPDTAHDLHGLATGPDGRIWFVSRSNLGDIAGSVKTDGSDFQYVALPSGSKPEKITAGPPGDNSVWFTESGTQKIGRITGLGSAPTPTPTPSPTPTPTPTPGNGPSLQISKTDDGRPWIDSQGTVNYTITYGNTGNETAHGVRLIEHPDPNEPFYGGGGFDSSGLLEIGDLAPGASGTVALSLNVGLDPADPESPPYEVHNEVEIKADASSSPAPGIAGALPKLVPGGNLDAFGADITPACTNGIACVCPLRNLFGSLETQFKRAATLVKAAAQDILLYYRVRDRVLAQSPGGKRYISLYYRHAAEISALLTGDASLRGLATTAMNAWSPSLQALVDGQGSGVSVTQAMSDSMTALLEKLKQEGSAGLRSDIQQEQTALNLPSLVGLPMDRASLAVDQRPCDAGDDHLCLNGGRFRVDVAWKVPEQARSGVGSAISLTGDTGYFWFFDSANVELVVKVLDATGVNGKFWVFYGALSDVAYTLTVTDTHTGAVRTYSNPDHNLASFADTSAFDPSESAPSLESQSASFITADQIAALSTTELYALYAARTQVARPKGTAPCTTGGETLCLNSGRFQVTVDWSVPSQGRSGTGTAAAVTGDTGYMWFFSPGNVELVIKVLDGRGINGHFWVFYGALSDVQYRITVKDTQTGAIRTYDNPSGTQASHADTSAF